MRQFPIEPEPEPSPAEKLRIALDLGEAGTELMLQNLRRRHPEADESEVERMLGEWLLERPGAEHGDAEGRPCQRIGGE
jgi:hypothetical protein